MATPLWKRLGEPGASLGEVSHSDRGRFLLLSLAVVFDHADFSDSLVKPLQREPSCKGATKGIRFVRPPRKENTEQISSNNDNPTDKKQ